MWDQVENPEDRFSHNEAQLVKNYLSFKDDTYVVVLLVDCYWFPFRCYLMQYTATFYGCKNDKFQMKKCDIFLIFAQNIDLGYTLESPQ